MCVQEARNLETKKVNSVSLCGQLLHTLLQKCDKSEFLESGNLQDRSSK
jgi:hypothetical protein